MVGNNIMGMKNMTKKWTIEDVLDPNSDFWIYSENEIWDWLDRLPSHRQDEAFKNIEEWIESGDIRMEDPPVEETYVSSKQTKKLAIQWSIQKGNFSGRTALQFAKNYSLNGP